jgi:uncharacterized protein YjbI with pentapeptide repeats
MLSQATGKVVVGLGLMVGTSLVSLGLSVVPATAAAAVKEPGKPTQVSAVGANTALYVTWAAPNSNGGSPIEGYLVTVSKAKSQKKSHCETTGATSCTAVGLINGKIYTVRVQAKNAKETGPASAPVNGTPSTAQDCAYIGPHANLQDCDLSDANLANDDLTNANFTGSNLADADLASARVTNVDLAGANLNGANLTSADLSDSVLMDTDAAGATFTNADVAGEYMPSVILTNANLTDADLYGSAVVDGTLTGADLGGATLTEVSSGGIVGTPSSLPSDWALTDGYLIGPGANLSDAALSGVDLANSDLSSVNLTDADVADTTLTSTDLSGATLSGVSSGGIVGTPSSLPSDWALTDGYLIGPYGNLSDAALSGVDLANSDLSFANLTEANLSTANLTNADLTFSNMTDADVADANLTDANLDEADMTGADLTGITWDDTICPDLTNSDNDGSTCVNNLG